jgi:hypothetical protein
MASASAMVGGTYADDGRQQNLEQPPQRPRDGGSRDRENGADTIGDGGSDLGVDRLEHERVDRQRPRTEQRCGAAERGADRTDPFGRQPLADESNRGARVQALQAAEGDAVTGALAVGLEVEHQDRKAGRSEKAGARQHAEPVPLHAVHQYDGAAAGPPLDEPAAQRRAGGGGDLDRVGAKTCGRRSDRCPCGRRQEKADGDDGRRKRSDTAEDTDGGKAQHYEPGATAPLTPALSIARVTKPDAIAAAVNSFTTAAVKGRSLA